MSDSTAEPSTIQPLPVYGGPSEAYAIDPGQPRSDRGTVTEHIIYTSLVVDDRYYDDAIRVQVDGIEKVEPFYLTAGATNSLITMLQRNILKLSRIRQLTRRTEWSGRKRVQAGMVLEVAQQLDEAGIVTVSMMVTAEDMACVSIPNLCDFHRALKIDAGHGRSSWRGIVVRIHMGRPTRGANLVMARTGGDAA